MAYAAITSLMSTIKQSMESGLKLQPFYEKLETLRADLEEPWNTPEDFEALTSLEVEIIELVYSAEDMVDTESIKVFQAETAITRKLAFSKFRFLLKRAVGRIDAAMNKLIAMRTRDNNSQDLKKALNSTLDHISERALEPENKMVGLENEFKIMKDQLSRGAFELQVVSIVGMGGIGKTTLATKIYGDPFIMSHFDIRAKTTVSHEYCVRNMILDLISSISGKTDQLYEHQDDSQLADRLQKLLKGRRYLVVMDDIWIEEAWDDMKLCFPDCDNGSRILLTTRNMEVAEYASSGNPPYQMRLLNFDESWNLLHKKVFKKELFPTELEHLGKQIAMKCRGLPLTIVVIAGLLSKIGKSLDGWKSIVENITSSVSTDLDVQCMRVLALSYHHLPHHLKACFVYLAIFPEDKLIFVNTLVKLWAAEGFLMIEETKRIEEVGRKYLQDLMDRSLIFIKHLTFDGKIKACGMHDVIRELCLREAQHANFVNVIIGKNHRNPCAQSMHFSSTERGRISIQSSLSPFEAKKLAKGRDSKARSIIFSGYLSYNVMKKMVHFKLLRVLNLASMKVPAASLFPNCILDLFHLRYLALTIYTDCLGIEIPPSIHSLYYLQTLILKFPYSEHGNRCLRVPVEIFNMQQLRHLCLDRNYFSCYFEPEERNLVLKNIQCLSGWNPLYCKSSFLRLLHKIKKLQICGSKSDYAHSNKDNMLHDLCYLNQLEKLKFRLKKFTYGAFSREHANSFPPLILPPPAAFPKNLKKLAFCGDFSLRWKDLSIVGKLPKLEALKLAYGACDGPVWEVVEDGFPHLKFLLLKEMHIKYWRASSDHFPCLERLFLEHCRHLDSIPQDFEGITALQLIDISFCAESVGNSAKQIQQDMEDNYGTYIEKLHVASHTVERVKGKKGTYGLCCYCVSYEHHRSINATYCV